MFNKSQLVYKEDIFNDELVDKLSKETLLNPAIIRYYLSKGYTNAEDINRFYEFAYDSLRKYDTYKDVDKFLKVLKKAVEKDEEITIYGDYDADGVMATTVLYKGLKHLGVSNVNMFVNNRFKEGYGINVAGMERLLATYPKTKLIVTCDNGVVGFDGVDYAKKHKVKVIVSDHHTASPDGRLPDCPVVCEHRLDESEELKENVCGAELARRLIEGLYFEMDRPKEDLMFARRLIAYSGLATVTDSVPMGYANHYIATKAVDCINATNRDQVFNVLRDVLEFKKADGDTIGFSIGPVINAISRIEGDVTKDLQLFTTESEEEMWELAKELKAYNIDRQNRSAQNKQYGKLEVEQQRMNDECLILSNEGIYTYLEDKVYKLYEEGMCGLVAGEMVKVFRKPCITLSTLEDDNTVMKGSARSIDGFNIKEALDICSQEGLLLGYGGHPAAAGLSISKDKIDDFRKRMCELVRESGALEAPTLIHIDLAAEAKDADVMLLNEIKKLDPHGPGFERPNLMFYGQVKSWNVMKEKHVRIILDGKGEEDLTVLWFNTDPKEWEKFIEENGQNPNIFAIGSFDQNIFNNKVNMQCIISDNMIGLF